MPRAIVPVWFALLIVSPSANAQDVATSVELGQDEILLGIIDEIFVEGIYDGGVKKIEVPASVDIIRAQQLETISAVHPAEALNSVAGLNIHRGSGQEHLTAMRSPVLTGGAGAGSFLYMEDGVPLRAAGFANVNGLFEGGTEFARQFEVFKGPGPAAYGSNAVHGLINIQSKKLSDPNMVRLLASDEGYLSAVTSVATGKLRTSISLAHDNGFRDASGFDQQKIQLKYEDDIGPWTVDASVSFNNLNQETAGFIQGDEAYRDKDIARSNPNPEAFRDGKSYRAQARLERSVGSNTLAFTPYARRAELRFLRHFVPGQALEKNGHSSVGLQTAYFGDDFNLGADVEFTEGFLYEFQDNPRRFSFTQGLHYDYEVQAMVGAVHGQKDVQIGPDTVLRIGARAEYTSYDYDNRASTGQSGRFIRVADRSDDFFTVTPKVSLRHSIGPSTAIYARASRGSRAPQVTDLYSVQSNQVAGQADVETLDSLEVGFKRQVLGAELDVSAFTMWKDNFFFRNANGFNLTNGKTRHTGIEVSASKDLSDWLTVSGDATFAKHSYNFSLDEGSPSNNISDGDRVDTAPDTLAHMRVTVRPTETFFTEVEWRHVGEYFTNPGNTNVYPGHDVFILRGGFDIAKKTHIFGRVDNVLNTRYADRADFAFGNERYFPGRPRTLFLGIKSDF